MRIICCGGIGEEGRSCVLLQAKDGAFLMVDCGVKREFTPGEPGRYPVLPEGLPKRFPLLLTHAHEDHVASIPWLIAQGYQPEIHTTACTASLGADYCRTWLKAVDKAIKASGGSRPYEEEHILAMDWHPLAEGENTIGPWKVMHGPAAHTPGSCWYHITHQDFPDDSVCVSGDWTARSLVYPHPDFPPCRTFITDASGKDGDGEGLDRLGKLVMLSLEKPILLPLPRMGRCQEMLCYMASLPELANKAGAVAMDAPLVDAIDTWLTDDGIPEKGRKDLELAKKLFADGRWIRFTRADEVPVGPRIIGAMDAMLSTGISGEMSERVLAEGGMVIFSGHAALGTPGRTLLDSGNPNVIRLPWKIHPEAADVEQVLENLKPENVILVHTPQERAAQIAASLTEKLGIRALAPCTGDVVEL